MTDAGALAVVGTICTAVTSAWGAWIHYQVNKNACGGAKCVETMTRALKITTGRIAQMDEEKSN